MKRLLLLASLFVALDLAAQPLLRVPQASPRARVEETFGVTDVAVDYHRPSVNGRRIWGGLVPYDVVWRGGANESTLITFSTPVKVEAQAVPAGTYSLFLIPGPSQWTVILNRFTGGWGTYSYDASEDLLRVKVTPQRGEMQERLAYTFDDGRNDAVTLSLRWEKLRVPVRIEAETTRLTLAGIEAQLRGSLHWVPQAWTEAARFALRSDETDKALAFIDHGMSLTPDAQSLRVKAAIVEKKGDAAQAKELRERAAALVPQSSALSRGYELHFAKKYDEALAYVNDYLTTYPNALRAWILIGMIQTARGDEGKAREAFDRATSLARDQSERVEVWDARNALAAGGER